MSLIVRFTRLSPTQHRFEAIRSDGTRETRELETRSFLLHDLVHFALESEAGLKEGFYGMLARGADYDTPADDAAAMQVESVVGPLQSAIKGDVDADAFVARFVSVQASIDAQAPAWLSADLICRVVERLRQLQGRWRSTPFGQAMELRFDA